MSIYFQIFHKLFSFSHSHIIPLCFAPQNNQSNVVWTEKIYKYTPKKRTRVEIMYIKWLTWVHYIKQSFCSRKFINYFSFHFVHIFEICIFCSHFYSKVSNGGGNRIEMFLDNNQLWGDMWVDSIPIWWRLYCQNWISSHKFGIIHVTRLFYHWLDDLEPEMGFDVSY